MRSHPDSSLLSHLSLTMSSGMVALLPPDTVFDHGRLIAWCVLGACAGAALGLSIAPPPADIPDQEQSRRKLFKFGIVAVNSFTVTPGIILHWGTIIEWESMAQLKHVQLGLEPASVALTSCLISVGLVVLLHFSFLVLAHVKKYFPHLHQHE